MLYCFVFLYFVFAGAGPWSVDAARVRAARTAIDKTGSGVVFTARSEGFIRNRPDLAETILAYQRAMSRDPREGAQSIDAPRYIAELLRKEGFTVRTNVAGMPTAWVAGYGARPGDSTGRKSSLPAG